MTARAKNIPGSLFFIKTKLGCSLYMIITDDAYNYSFFYLYIDINQRRSALKTASSLFFRHDEALNVCF
jgi:hypothetical protein